MKKPFFLLSAHLLLGCDQGPAHSEPAPTPTPIVIGNAWRITAVPDLTGDGIGDLVSAVVDVPESGVIVYAGPIGDTLPPPFATFVEPEGVRIGSAFLGALDLIGDGAPDLVAGALFDGRLFVIEGPLLPGPQALLDGLVLQGDGSAFFGSSVAAGAIAPGASRALAMASPGEPEESCFSATGVRVVTLPLVSGTASVAITSGFDPFQCPGSWLVARDFTGDGTDDLLMASTDGGTWIFDGPISGQLTSADAVHFDVMSGVYGYWIAAPGALIDVDADGDDDLALMDRNTGEIVVHSLPIGAVPVRLPVPGIPLERQGDLNGDGFGDLVLVDDEFYATQVWVMLSPLGSSSQTLTGTFEWVTVGDVTNDGRADVLTLGTAGMQVFSF